MKQMTQQQIKQTWRGLILPLVAGLIIIIVAILWNRFGSKSDGPQLLSGYLGIFGIVLAVAAGQKMIKFRKYLKGKA